MATAESITPAIPYVTSNNPLENLGPPRSLISYARKFYRAHDLKDLVTEADFVKGALYFRDPGSITRAGDDRHGDMIETLTLDEPLTLKPESFHSRELDLSLTRLDVLSLMKFREDSRGARWRNSSLAYRMVLTACALGSITQGWDQSAMGGANLGWDISLELPGCNTASELDERNSPSDQHDFLFGLVQGAPFLFGAFAGFFFTDILIKWRFTRRRGLGRRGVLLVAGLFSFFPSLVSAFLQSWEQLLVCRLLLGVGMASKAVIVPILLSETAPKEIRGMAVTWWQLFVSFGILLGSLFNLAVYKFSNDHTWRYMLGGAAIPPLLLFILVPFCIESPRWLLKEQRVPDALIALQKVYDLPSPIIACGDLLFLHESLYEETQLLLKISPQPQGPDAGNEEYQTSHNIKQANWGTRWKIMVSSQRMRTQVFLAPVQYLPMLTLTSAVYTAMAVMVSQQTCGINLFAFFSSDFYLETIGRQNRCQLDERPTEKDQILAIGLGVAFGGVNFLFSLLAFFLIDWEKKPKTHGMKRSWYYHLLPDIIDRRTLLNFSFPSMAVCLLIAGLILFQGDPKGADPKERYSIPVIVIHYVFLYLFTAAYSMGEGPVAFLVSSEVFPLVNREIGLSIAVFFNFIGAAIISIFAPKLIKAIRQPWTLVLFACLNVASWLACYILVPDTHKQSLEAFSKQLDTSFPELIQYRGRKFLSHSGLVERPDVLHEFVKERRRGKKSKRARRKAR